MIIPLLGVPVMNHNGLPIKGNRWRVTIGRMKWSRLVSQDQIL